MGLFDAVGNTINGITRGISGGSVNKSKSSTFLDPNQLPYLTNLWNQAQNLGGNSTFVGANPYMNASWGMTGNAANTANNMANEMYGANNYLMNPTNTFNPYSMAATNYAAGGLQNQFNDTLNNLRSEGIAAGQWTPGTGQGTFNKSVTKALDPFSRAMEGLYTNMGSNIYNTGMNNMNAAIERMPNIANLGFMGANAMNTAGTQMRDIAQQQAMEPWQRLQLMQSIYGPAISQTTQKSNGTSTNGLLGGGVGQGLSGLANLGLASGILSLPK